MNNKKLTVKERQNLTESRLLINAAATTALLDLNFSASDLGPLPGSPEAPTITWLVRVRCTKSPWF